MNLSSSVLALVLALLTVVLTGGPPFIEAIRQPSSAIMLVPAGGEGTTYRFLASNAGDEHGILTGIRVFLELNGSDEGRAGYTLAGVNIVKLDYVKLFNSGDSQLIEIDFKEMGAVDPEKIARWVETFKNGYAHGATRGGLILEFVEIEKSGIRNTKALKIEEGNFYNVILRVLRDTGRVGEFTEAACILFPNSPGNEFFGATKKVCEAHI